MLCLSDSGRPFRAGTPDAASITIVDNEPLVSVEATDPQAAEAGPDTGLFTVRRIGDTTNSLVVNYSVVPSYYEVGAEAGVDYVALPGSVTIPAGAGSVTITVTPIADPLAERDEIVRINLAEGSYQTSYWSRTAAVTIMDNKPTVSIVATDPAAAETGPNSGTFTVTRVGGNLSQPLTVQYAVSGTANQGADYSALSGTITIPAGAESATIVVTPVDDAQAETSETVRIDLGSSNVYRMGASAGASVNLSDNDVAVSVSRTRDSVREDPSDKINVTLGHYANEGFVFSRHGGDLSKPVSIGYTVGGTATPNVDYDALICSVTLPSGVDRVTVFLDVFDDAITEQTETVTVTLAQGSYTIEGTGTSVLSLYDDESVVSIDADLANLPESGSQSGHFVFTRSSSTNFDLGVNFVVSGAATLGTDYTGFTGLVNGHGNILIPAGQASVSILITPVQDSLNEGNEAILVSLEEGNYDQALPTTVSASVTILDDEPVVTIAATDASASEAGLDPGIFTVTRTGSTTNALAVDYTVNDYYGYWGYGAKATAGSDYVALSGSVTIPAGQASATIVVTLIDDSLAEGDEVVRLALAITSAYSLGATSAAIVTIADDEPVVTIAATDASASEAGLDPGIFTVTRTGPTTNVLAVDYTVNDYYGYWGYGAKATAGSDYVALSGSVTIPAGQASATIVVTLIDDSLAEGDEVVRLALAITSAYSLGATSAAIVTIADDEPVVTIAATDASASEAGLDPGIFTVTRTGSTTNALSITYSISGNAIADGDYNGLTGTVTIPAGSAAADITVTPREDILAEVGEVVAVTLMGGSGYTLGTATMAVVNLADNESSVTVQATDPSAAEQGADHGVFTISRAGGTPDVAIIVHYLVAGTAAPGADYTGVPLEKMGSVTIPVGQSSIIVDITPVDDVEGEPDEAIQLTLYRNTTYRIESPSGATVVLADNDPVVTVTAFQASISESSSNTGQFDVLRTGNTSAAITVSYVASGSATSDVDYAVLSGSVTIPAGAASASICVTPIDDRTVESEEMVTVTLQAGPYLIGTAGSATTALTDDDFDALVTVEATDAQASEEGEDPGAFLITRRGNTSAELQVSYRLSSLATPSVDYDAFPATITIPAGQSTATLAVEPIDDSVGESVESIQLSLVAGGSYSVGTAASAVVSIVDNEPVVTIEATAPTASESNPQSNRGEFTVRRTGPTTNDLRVDYNVDFWGTQATAGSDYVPLPDSFIIPAGQASVTIPVAAIDDQQGETDEQLRVRLAGRKEYSLGNSSNAAMTIVDNEPLVTIAAFIPTAREQGQQAGQFVVTRSGGELQSELTVFFRTSGSAGADDDYVGLPGVVTIPVGAATASINVTPVNDLVGENDETVSVSLTTGAYRIGTFSSASVMISDNEPVVSIEITDGSISERGPDAGVLTIRRSGGNLSSPLAVLLVSQGQAMPGEDYISLPQSVEIPANATSITVPLTPIVDSLLEGDERVDVLLKLGAYRVGSPASALTKIVDDYPHVSVSATDAAASEDSPDSAQVTFTRTGCDLGSPLTVNYTVGGTATAGADYQALAGTIVIPANSASVVLPITPIDDALGEIGETVVITVAQGLYDIVQAAAAATISDNESLVSITVTQSAGAEQGSAPATFTVTRAGGNQTAGLAVGYSLSGTAGSGDYTASPSGSVVIPANQSSATITITPIDDAVAEAAETVTVTLGTGAYRLPNLWQGYVSGTATITDNEPIVSIAASQPVAQESDQSAGAFTVTRQAANVSASLQVSYSITGTAAPGSDCQALTGTVTIPANQTTAQIAVAPIADGVLEQDETVILTLVPQTSYRLADSWGQTSTATVTIHDDKPIVSITASDPDAAEGGTNPGQFTVSRTGSTLSSLTVYYAASTTGSSLANPNADYPGLPGLVVLPAGSASATIAVTPVDDILAEPSEKVQLALSSSGIYRVSSTEATAVVTIADNDPQVSVDATDATATEGGSDAGEFTVTRTGGDWSRPLTVLYTLSGTAVAGMDYSGPSVLAAGSVTIQPGSPSATIPVTPIDDALGEPDELIVITLRSNTTYFLGAATDTITLVDNEPRVSVVASDPQAAEDGLDPAQFTVTRTGPTTSSLTVHYSVSGTAAQR